MDSILMDILQSVDEIMLDILTNYAHPTKACTNIRYAEPYIPEDHEYHINRNSINCWIFQDHFDCVASAIAGGINAVLGFPRGESLFSTKEIVHALDIIHCWKATRILENLQKEYPSMDWDVVKGIIVSSTKLMNLGFFLNILLEYQYLWKIK